MKREFETLSDGSIIYNFNNFKEILSERGKNKNIILIEHVILALLNSIDKKPIYGRTMFMKQIFLTYNEILSGKNFKTQNPHFVPYYYGPFSFLVSKTIDDLELDGCIERFGLKNSKIETFIISKKGKGKYSKSVVFRKSMIIDEIKQKRIGWDQLGTEGILRYVYTYYPNFRNKSVIKNRFKEITWGAAGR